MPGRRDNQEINRPDDTFQDLNDIEAALSALVQRRIDAGGLNRASITEMINELSVDLLLRINSICERQQRQEERVAEVVTDQENVVQELECKIDTVLTRVEALESAPTPGLENIQEQTNKIHRLEERLLVSEAYLDEKAEDVNELLAVVRGHTSEIEEMTTDVDEVKQRMAVLEASDQRRRTEDGCLRDRMAELEARVNEAELTREQLRQSLQAQHSGTENRVLPDSATETIEKLEKFRRKIDDSYWNRCLVVKNFSARTNIRYDRILSYVKFKLNGYGYGNILEDCDGFFLSRNGNLRLEYKTRLSALCHLQELRQRSKSLQSTTLSFEFGVPPRFVGDKCKLAALGMRMKRAKVLDNYEIRVSSSSAGPILRMKTFVKPWNQSNGIAQNGPRPAIEKFYSLEDVTVIEALIAGSRGNAREE